MKHFNAMLSKLEKLFSKKIDTSPDENKKIDEMITSKGYPFETHSVHTQDGYNLKIFRIPAAKSETPPETNTKQPVLFQHGLFDSADGWVCNEESRCLPYIMANMGYDVWLSNSRGNKYCKSHSRFDEKAFEFWQFSLNEMGLYDLPAVLEYITATNKSNEKVIYFGHSQGTSMLFSALAQNCDYYTSKIKLFVALAPVARLSNMSSKLLKLAQKSGLNKLLKKASMFEVFPSNEDANEFNSFLNNHFPSITNKAVEMLSDSSSKEANDNTQLSVYMRHFPSGTSLKCLNHFIQILKAKKFVYYDYKPEANCFIYKRPEPPEYDLSVIKNMPIMLIGGEEDRLATPDDVKWLKEVLGSNCVYQKTVPVMGHISFMVGKDIDWFKEPLEIIVNNYSGNLPSIE